MGTRRVDERDIMFSRYLLEPGSHRFETYYREQPDKRGADDRFRRLPGVLATDASASDPVLFGAARASFEVVKHLRRLVDGEVAEARVDTDAESITSFLTRWMLRLGACSVGATELREEHLYSHAGRGDDYGKPVVLQHRFALAFTTEMDHEMVARAPMAPTTMESARSYMESGAIAVQIAALIRGLGYPARAHIDGNYKVVCPLVARDAGLGEIGRMGLLMTPTVGPRVRIGVITTDLPLVASPRNHDPSVEDFCNLCDRCVVMCPAKAIPTEKRDVEGETRWQIDSEACFTFWCRIGTDCARCMAVCPQAHPDTPLHRAVRWGVRRSRRFRRLALRADKFVYGKWPAPARLADWMKTSEAR
jgi:ferredoxin